MDGLAVTIPGTWTGDVSSLPLLLPGLPVTPNARYAATDLAVTDGTAVTSWPERNGGAPLTAVATAPTKRTASTEPVVRFSADASRLTKTFAPTSPVTLFLLHRLTVVEGGKYLGIVTTTSAGGGGIATAGDSNYQVYGSSGFSSQPGTADTSWTVLAVVINGASSAIYLDGAQVGTGNPGNIGGGNLSIGNDGSTAKFDVSEVLVYESALTAGQVSAVATALRSGHPALSD